MALSIDDQLAIQQLYARYNQTLDYARPAEWVACWTVDGRFTAPAAGLDVSGADALLVFARDVIPTFMARHWNNNLVLDGDGSRADGTCYMLSWQVPGDGQPKTLLNTGVYVDELVKGSDGWRFKSRALDLE